MSKTKVYLFLILANLFWAGNYVFGKYVVAELPPVHMMFWRWSIAVCLLFPIAQLVERPRWKEVWKRWRVLLLMAVLGAAGYNFLLYEALRHTTSMNAALVNAMNPALIVLLSAIILKEKISRYSGLGIVISLLGVLLVITNGHLLGILHLSYNIGDLLMLLAILVWTFYSILGRRIKTVPPIAATAVLALFTLIMVSPWIIASGIKLPQSQMATAGIIYFGIFPSVGSLIFWNTAIREIGASRSGIYLNLITVFTAILSLILGTPITWVQVAGGLLVFAGVYLASVKGQQTDNKKLLPQK